LSSTADIAQRQASAADRNGGRLPNVAITGNGGGITARVVEVLVEAGCDADAVVDETTEVVISAHERAGAEVCAEIRERGQMGTGVLTVLVVEQASVGDVRRAVQAGARAIVTDASVNQALLPSITAALAGQIVLPASVGADAAPKVLTTREKQILGLVVMGMTNAEIATKLFLAESTVKSHLSSAFSKLGVSSRSEAATVILNPDSGAGLGILTIPSK